MEKNIGESFVLLVWMWIISKERDKVSKNWVGDNQFLIEKNK